MATDESANRTERIPVRLTPAEKELFQLSARHLEVSASELLREATLEKIQRDVGLQLGSTLEDGPPPAPALADGPPPPPAI